MDKNSNIKVEHIKAEELDETVVTLDTYNCDLNLDIDGSKYEARPLTVEGFAFMWAGARATHGAAKGKFCFEVKVLEHLDVSHLPADEPNPHVVRVGVSVENSSLQLGEDPLSYGYGGTGKISTNCQFKDFGETFIAGDCILCAVCFESGQVRIGYAKNGKFLGWAYRINESELKGKALFPHILTKNCSFEVNLGQKQVPYFDLPEPVKDYTFIGCLPLEQRVAGTRCPKQKSDCEMIMMCGLPGAGKSVWAAEYSSKHPEKKYNVLGTNNIIDKMKVMGLPRKRNYHGRWDVLIQMATKCLNRLFEIGSKHRRNYILDQTNVYPSAQKRKMRNFEGFKRKAVVVVPSEEEFKRRCDKQERAEGKEIPEHAILEMKANFKLPEVGDTFDEVIFTELQRDKAEKLVIKYNEEGRSAIGPSKKIFRPNESGGNQSFNSGRGNFTSNRGGGFQRGRFDGGRGAQSGFGGSQGGFDTKMNIKDEYGNRGFDKGRGGFGGRGGFTGGRGGFNDGNRGSFNDGGRSGFNDSNRSGFDGGRGSFGNSRGFDSARGNFGSGRGGFGGGRGSFDGSRGDFDNGSRGDFDSGRGSFTGGRGGFSSGRGGFDGGREGFDSGRGSFNGSRGGFDNNRGFRGGRGGFGGGRGGGYSGGRDGDFGADGRSFDNNRGGFDSGRRDEHGGYSGGRGGFEDGKNSRGGHDSGNRGGFGSGRGARGRGTQGGFGLQRGGFESGQGNNRGGFDRKRNYDDGPGGNSGNYDSGNFNDDPSSNFGNFNRGGSRGRGSSMQGSFSGRDYNVGNNQGRYDSGRDSRHESDFGNQSSSYRGNFSNWNNSNSNIGNSTRNYDQGYGNYGDSSNKSQSGFNSSSNISSRNASRSFTTGSSIKQEPNQGSEGVGNSNRTSRGTGRPGGRTSTRWSAETTQAATYSQTTTITTANSAYPGYGSSVKTEPVDSSAQSQYTAYSSYSQSNPPTQGYSSTSTYGYQPTALTSTTSQQWPTAQVPPPPPPLSANTDQTQWAQYYQQTPNSQYYNQFYGQPAAATPVTYTPTYGTK